MKWNTIQYRKWLNRCTQGGGGRRGTLSNNFEFQLLKLIELSFEWSYFWITFQRLGWNNLGTKCKHFGHWNVVWIKIKKMLKASFLSGLPKWNNHFCVPPKGSGNENVLFATFRRGWSTMVVNQSELEFERRKRSTFSLPPVFIVAGRWMLVFENVNCNSTHVRLGNEFES